MKGINSTPVILDVDANLFLSLSLALSPCDGFDARIA